MAHAEASFDLRRRMQHQRAAIQRRIAHARDRAAATAGAFSAALLSARSIANQTVSNRGMSLFPGGWFLLGDPPPRLVLQSEIKITSVFVLFLRVLKLISAFSESYSTTQPAKTTAPEIRSRSCTSPLR